jgi:uncharacterized membrane protein
VDWRFDPASCQEVYQIWRDFEQSPRFMHHVISVHDAGNRRWHWTVKGPGGVRVEWDAEVKKQDKCIKVVLKP